MARGGEASGTGGELVLGAEAVTGVSKGPSSGVSLTEAKTNAAFSTSSSQVGVGAPAAAVTILLGVDLADSSAHCSRSFRLFSTQ